MIRVFKVSIIISVSLVLPLLMTPPVIAERICVHGNVGLFQEDPGYMHRFGWGLDFYIEDAGWLQYSTPVNPGKTYRTVLVTVEIPKNNNYGACSTIDRIDVWDGNNKVDGYRPHLRILSGQKPESEPLIYQYYIHLPNWFRKFQLSAGISILPAINNNLASHYTDYCLSKRMKILSVCIE